MRLSTALFGSVVAICCTVGLVSGQVKFADGSEQTTAFTGQTTVPTGRPSTKTTRPKTNPTRENNQGHDSRDQ